MHNKLNLVTIFLIGLVVLTGCWSPNANDDVTRSKPTPTASGTTTTPSSSNDNSNAPNTKSNNATPSPTGNNSPTPVKSGGLQGNLPSGFQIPSDDVGNRMFREYGAMFVAKKVTPPTKVVFRDEAEVSAFQSSVQKVSENIGGFTIELQTAAMSALKAAIAEAGQKKLSIKPRNKDSAKRSYGQTVENWKSRVDPGLKEWVSKGKLPSSEAERIKKLSAEAQVPEIFKLESQGMNFSKDFSKSIIYSVAPPGTSQHISMLALDVEQYANPEVRSILARHGWFQTVASDLPHFTYLGVQESELPGLGLKKVTNSGQTFWVPDM